MAISKVIYKSSASAQGEVWIDATLATAVAADIISPKTAMLANGVITQGTGNNATLGTKTITANGIYTASSDSLDGYSSITVAVPNNFTITDTANTTGTTAVITAGTGGDTQEQPVILPPIKDVVFVDYDGEIVYEYTADEFLALTAMPANPSHTGLTAQGWNWSLADAQTYVEDNECLVIGQNYTTSDGKTRIYLTITDQNNIGPMNLYMITSAKGCVTIDWGDGSTKVTDGNADANKNYMHTYSSNGDYVITLDCTEGNTYQLGYNGANKGCFGDNSNVVTYVSAKRVTAIEIGDRMTRLYDRAFNYTSRLLKISIPTTLTNFGTGLSGSSARCVVFPNGTTSVSSTPACRFIAYPKTLTSPGTISGGSMRAFTLPETTTDKSGNWSLPSAERISIPGTYTTIGGGGTNSRMVRECYYCRKLVIPSSVTTINDYAICDNYGIIEVHLKPTEVPTLNATRAFTGAPSTRVYYVPYSEDHSILNAYQTATNWTTFASQIQEEPQ